MLKELGLADVAVADERVTAEPPDRELAEVNKALVTAGVRVRGFGVERASLEDAFVALTGRASMSRAELAVRAPRMVWTFGLLRSELVTTFRRWRTLALLGVLAAVPILVGIAVKVETRDGSSVGRGNGGAGARVHRRDHQQRAVPGVHRAGRDPAFLSAHGHRGGRR